MHLTLKACVLVGAALAAASPLPTTSSPGSVVSTTSTAPPKATTPAEKIVKDVLDQIDPPPEGNDKFFQDFLEEIYASRMDIEKTLEGILKKMGPIREHWKNKVFNNFSKETIEKVLRDKDGHFDSPRDFANKLVAERRRSRENGTAPGNVTVPVKGGEDKKKHGDHENLLLEALSRCDWDGYRACVADKGRDECCNARDNSACAALEIIADFKSSDHHAHSSITTGPKTTLAGIETLHAVETPTSALLLPPPPGPKPTPTLGERMNMVKEMLKKGTLPPRVFDAYREYLRKVAKEGDPAAVPYLDAVYDLIRNMLDERDERAGNKNGTAVQARCTKTFPPGIFQPTNGTTAQGNATVPDNNKGGGRKNGTHADCEPAPPFWGLENGRRVNIPGGCWPKEYLDAMRGGNSSSGSVQARSTGSSTGSSSSNSTKSLPPGILPPTNSTTALGKSTGALGTNGTATDKDGGGDDNNSPPPQGPSNGFVRLLDGSWTVFDEQGRPIIRADRR